MMGVEYTIDENSDEDLDSDGLTNKQEKEYKTDSELSDTDLDGLDDYYEIFTSKTDPNKKDSDNDGLSDYDEIKLELDPLKSDSKNDGVKDGKRELTYNYESNNVKISITGSGNIASTVAEVSENTKISGKVGFIDKLYNLYTEGTLKEAILTLSYTDEELTKYGINEDDLTIYYYNANKNSYEKIDTTIDKTNKTVTAKLNHFSRYILGNGTIIEENTEVLFVLDNSWSMYTNEQYKKYTGEDYDGGIYSSKLDGFDAEGIRFTLTSKLVSKLSEKEYKIGLSEFRSDYANIYSVGSDAKKINKKLKNMQGNFVTKTAGTNITNALNKSIDDFLSDASIYNNKYIVILTDGQDSSLSSNAEKIITKATKNNVKICSVGFGGSSYNIELSNISNATGCKFYSSSDSNGLVELFENLETEINNHLVDFDGDNNIDGVLIADSGFIVNRDGFSFENYGSNLSKLGHCYGMATFAELYYKKVLPLKLDSKTAKEEKSYAYNLTNTYFETYNNLYDYKLKTNFLKHIFGFEYFNEKIPADYRNLKGNINEITDKYKEDIKKSGEILYIEQKESGITKKQQMKKYGYKYELYDEFYFNEDKMQNNSAMDNDDIQLFNAIYAAQIKQYSDKKYISTEIGGGFINVLKTRLNDKDIPVISIRFPKYLVLENGHAINAISLVQNLNNPNYYYIAVYDSNFPGEKRYIDVECKTNIHDETICYAKPNDYYDDIKKAIRITPSLEQNLVYYN